MQETADAAPAPPLRDMRSTPVSATTTHQDGTTAEGTISVVHAPGAPVPASMTHPCGPHCERCAP